MPVHASAAAHDPLGLAGGASDALAELAAALRPAGLSVHHVPPRAARTVPWPDWVAPPVRVALLERGISAPWSHQVSAADAAWRGEHVVLSTGTASGKSLGYLLPVLTALHEGAAAPNGRGATALYLAPTKALAEDQLSRVSALLIPGVRAACYDGDTPPDERTWVRDHASYVLTNPDLLHHSLLPGHERWAGFLRRLRYVVVDECHAYRGVWGSHVALVLRRLRRVAARYGASPTFVLASATVSAPAAHAERLIGMPCSAVEIDGSPHPGSSLALWEPRWDDGAASRRSALTESASILTDLLTRDTQTVAFARSRVGVETLARMVRERLDQDAPHLTDRVAAYRSGYLPEERRLLERAVRARTILGLAATSALELGVDIAGLDAVVLVGWPRTLSSFWQQVGRAGRAESPALGVFVADDDPLDTYLVRHPEAILGRPVEASVCDPSNPFVLAPHLGAAAAELPVTLQDTTYFGPTLADVLDSLVRAGALRRRPTGWYWAHEDRASDHVSLRGAGQTVRVVESASGRVIGTVDEASADRQVHAGAVYVHQGRTFVVTELDRAEATALAVAGDPGWTTRARAVSDFAIVDTRRATECGPVLRSFGEVRITRQFTSFQRRLPSGEVIGEHPIDAPERTLLTSAVWWSMPVEALMAHGVQPADIAGAAHAAEHAAIGLLPLFAAADRWDIGGVSTALHPDTGQPTILIYDGYPGGAGFAERGYAVADDWLGATLRTIAECRCESGCPACVQSPKCGNGNEPLDKAGAVRLLGLLLTGARARPELDHGPARPG